MLVCHGVEYPQFMQRPKHFTPRVKAANWKRAIWFEWHNTSRLRDIGLWSTQHSFGLTGRKRPQHETRVVFIHRVTVTKAQRKFSLLGSCGRVERVRMGRMGGHSRPWWICQVWGWGWTSTPFGWLKPLSGLPHINLVPTGSSYPAFWAEKHKLPNSKRKVNWNCLSEQVFFEMEEQTQERKAPPNAVHDTRASTLISSLVFFFKLCSRHWADKKLQKKQVDRPRTEGRQNLLEWREG